MATGQQVREVLVALRHHGERLFPTRRRLEENGERENPGGDDPVRVSIFLCFIYLCSCLYIYLCYLSLLTIVLSPGYCVHDCYISFATSSNKAVCIWNYLSSLRVSPGLAMPLKQEQQFLGGY